MTTSAIPTRDQIEDQYKWNAPSVFESDDAWDAAYAEVQELSAKLGQYKGRLKEGPAVLKAFEHDFEKVIGLAGKLFVYAGMNFSVNATDPVAGSQMGRVQNLMGIFSAASAFLAPEMIEVGLDTLSKWMEEDPALRQYEHFINDLMRQQKHVLSAEIEEVLGSLSPILSASQSINNTLTNAEFTFEDATDSEGNSYPVSHGLMGKYFGSSDRQLRESAWNAYQDQYLKFRQTLSATLNASVNKFAAEVRLRKHESSVAMSLSEHNIPVAVYHQLVETFRKNLPTWHRYFDLKARVIGVEKLAPYDMWAPLIGNDPTVTYEQAVDWICEGMAPLGEEYVQTMRAGCLENRWVDVFPNQGKRQGAFSSGVQGTHPFIMMSFNDSVRAMSTLAHELGHSMHSYLTWQNQPNLYSRYSLFAAEVASNFNQALTRDYLLKNSDDREFLIAVIDEAMSNFYRYFFIMPTLARFELETHDYVEKGGALSADYLTNLCTELFTEAFGPNVELDKERISMYWANFSHLFSDFYVYQYATGISGAHALAQGVLDNEDGAVEDYLTFLKAGSSVYPLDALKAAGVDLTSSEPVDAAFKVMAGYVERLEALLS